MSGLYVPILSTYMLYEKEQYPWDIKVTTSSSNMLAS